MDKTTPQGGKMTNECTNHTPYTHKTHKHVHHNQIIHTTLDTHINNSYTGRQALAVNAGG
jgi:hypothetical protein